MKGGRRGQREEEVMMMMGGGRKAAGRRERGAMSHQNEDSTPHDDWEQYIVDLFNCQHVVELRNA